MSKQKSKNVGSLPAELEKESTPDGRADNPATVEVKTKLDIEVDVELLRSEVEKLREDMQEHKDKYLRAMAEVENTRRRAENDVSSARKFAVESFAAEALSVKDSLELARAIEIKSEDSEVVIKMKEGLDLTLKQLDSVFSKFNIKEIAPQPGDKLDPEQHQAMSLQESTEVPPNHIVNVIQKGYSIHDRLLRPAMVIVAKVKSEEQAEIEAENP